MKRSGELKRKTRLSPVGKKRRLATGARGPSLVLPPRHDDDVDAAAVATRFLARDIVREVLAEPSVIEARTAARAALHAVPKEAPARDEAFLSLARTKPCACCDRVPPSDPAHVGKRGLGQKTDDHRTVPLCRRCHRFLDVNHYLPLDGPNTPPVHRAPEAGVRRLKLWTRLRIAEAQRELLVEYVREILGRAA